ncbi:polymeric immunoglobulin receptor-like [Paramisgurnus dabryanus]|uniref:polymeric immunoglobulin receptor-like n=1 Tax=Paramisgurnus dabryanus TaxID=90735 RepID=UPI0031F3FA5D
MAHHLILFIILLYIAVTVSITTLYHVSVREGGTVTIPCLYDSRYKLNPKYWCTGTFWSLCTITAHTGHTDKTGKWLITDDLSKNIFTVQLNNLTTFDSGFHWCGVGIKDSLDEKAKLFITVQTAPDVSVMSSSVTVDEGGNISVQCLYTSTYENKHKQWCRFKDKKCDTVGKSGTSQYSVEISDDGRGSLTVVMSGLMKSDSGWYYCSVGDLQAPVQLIVQLNSTSQKDLRLDNVAAPIISSECKNHPIIINNTEDNTCPSTDHRNGILQFLWITGLLMLLLVVALLTWWIKRKQNGDTPDPSSVAERSVWYGTVVFKKANNGSIVSLQEPHPSSVEERSVWYSTIVFKKAKEDEDDDVFIGCSTEKGDEVIYSAVKYLK